MTGALPAKVEIDSNDWIDDIFHGGGGLGGGGLGGGGAAGGGGGGATNPDHAASLLDLDSFADFAGSGGGGSGTVGGSDWAAFQ